MTAKQECCDVHNPNLDSVQRVSREMCGKEILSELAETFGILGDPVRVGILHALSHGELCVCDLAEILGMSHSAVSHQLRLLRTARMVRFEKRGRRAFYSLDDKHVETLIKTAIEHTMHHGCR